MRDLTEAELDLISGGLDDTEDVVVVGPSTPPPDNAPQPTPVTSDPSPGGDTPHTSNTSSGGGSHSSSPTLDPTTDQKADAAALDLAAKIQKMPDSDHQEYGAWIYKDKDGNIKESNILKGPDAGTSPFGKAANEFGVPDGATLIGQIHNHPTYLPDGREATGRAYPDNFDLNAVSGAAGYAVRDHDIKVDATNFRSYISHDGKVDEYDAITHTTVYDTSKGIEEERSVSSDGSQVISSGTTTSNNSTGGDSADKPVRNSTGRNSNGGHTAIP